MYWLLTFKFRLPHQYNHIHSSISMKNQAKDRQIFKKFIRKLTINIKLATKICFVIYKTYIVNSAKIKKKIKKNTVIF